MSGCELGVAAMGANCGNNLPDTEAALVQMVAVAGDIPVIAKANAGIPQWRGAELAYSGSPEVAGAHAHRVRTAGVPSSGLLWQRTSPLGLHACGARRHHSGARR